jgi:hypothetical protein
VGTLDELTGRDGRSRHLGLYDARREREAGGDHDGDRHSEDPGAPGGDIDRTQRLLAVSMVVVTVIDTMVRRIVVVALGRSGGTWRIGGMRVARRRFVPPAGILADRLWSR